MKFLTVVVVVVVVVVVGGYSTIQKKKTGRNRTIHWSIHHCCSLCFPRDFFCSPTFELRFNLSSMCSLSSCKLIASSSSHFLESLGLGWVTGCMQNQLLVFFEFCQCQPIVCGMVGVLLLDLDLSSGCWFSAWYNLLQCLFRVVMCN
jgi:hypothetical protein